MVNGTCSCGDADCRSPGKHPRTSKGHNEATNDIEQVKSWWKAWPTANIGYRPKENEIVLDIEKEGIKNGLLRDLIKRFGPPPVTKTSNTGGGGQHHFYKLPEGAPEIRNRAKVFDGMDIRTVKGYVILPPSNHASGGLYIWEARAGRTVNELPIEWCNGIAAGQKTTPQTKARITRDEYADGNRNNAMFRMASAARGKGKEEDEILKELRRENKKLCSPPLIDSELKKIVESVARYKPGGLDVEEEEAEQERIARLRKLVTGNVDNLKLDHMELLKLVNEVNHIRKPAEQTDSYAAYTHGVYITGAEAKNEITKTVNDILMQCGDAMGRDVQRLYTARVNTELWNQIRLTATPTAIDEWDKDDCLLNVLNGVVNLLADELLPHSPDYLMTKQATVRYDPGKKCPKWDAVVEKQFGTGDMAKYFQAVCGRLLTGDVNSKAFYLMHGGTDTGKSLILGTAASILGTYAVRASRETFVASQYDNPRWEVANWIGARLVHVQEFKPGDYWHEPLLKDITGGEVIAAVEKHMKPFNYKPKCKVVMATNHIPKSNTMDHSFADRVRIIPCEHRIPEAEKDYNMYQRLMKEYSGILNYMIEGIKILDEIGQGVPEWMKEHLDSYKIDEDPLCMFTDNTIEEARGQKVQATPLYDNYVKYMYVLKMEPITPTAFGTAMRNKGYKKGMSNGKTFYLNIALKNREDWFTKDTQSKIPGIKE
jgi:putative DNA primase/helicase